MDLLPTRKLITPVDRAGRSGGPAGPGRRAGMPVLRRAACWCAVAAVALAAAAVPGVSRAVAAPRSLSSPSWTKLAVPKLPAGAGGIAYDAANHTMVMFGGITAAATWVWNGTTWVRKHPATSPLPLTGGPMAYDAATHTVVMFGNDHGAPQTWIWNGTTWTQEHPATSPPALNGAAMAYDAATHTVVLFGGRGQSRGRPTWIWNGTTWIRKLPASSPPTRIAPSMAYDAATHTVVMFGGEVNYSPNAYADTWSWNGTAWTQQHPAASPSGRWIAAMAYDPATRTVVLFGGFNNDNGQGYLNDTWTWNGTAWTQQDPATSPSARCCAAMAYYPATHNVLLFGGTNGTVLRDAWTWGP